jgi:hypothetical protein
MDVQIAFCENSLKRKAFDKMHSKRKAFDKMHSKRKAFDKMHFISSQKCLKTAGPAGG